MSKDGLSITEMEERGGSKRSQKAASLPLVVTIIVSKEATENAAILNTISKVLDVMGTKDRNPSLV